MIALLSVAGCSGKSGAKMPTYDKNPTPKQRYDVTVVIENAPGPFAVVHGAVQYDIANMDCLPPAESFSGAQTTPISTFVPIVLKRVNDTTFEGQFALDELVDGDYFGRGICHFKPIGPSFSLKASQAAGDTKFVASRWANELEQADQLTTYYWRASYPRHAKIEDYSDLGSSSPDEYKESVRSELFSVSVRTRKVPE
ncbi:MULTISPECIES: hypothetical protein [Lysobacter]|nr:MULTISPECIES: hypothetical protein [Lysobacter]